MYLVIACPRCRRSRVVEAGKKSTSCGSCGRALALADLRPLASAGTLEEAQHAAGLVNARLVGREREFLASLLPQEAPAARHDDPYDAAAAAARKASSESDRVDEVARALFARLGAFAEEDLEEAFHRAGIPAYRLESHLVRMLATNVLYEPRAGRYAGC